MNRLPFRKHSSARIRLLVAIQNEIQRFSEGVRSSPSPDPSLEKSRKKELVQLIIPLIKYNHASLPRLITTHLFRLAKSSL